ncbi:signaling protein [Sphingomonas donggukensis]|uniref:Signaling protein n=1 Tax=Sphingomonas donggukensis TaxID=2949093 RepID=A0ABY4TVK0_9SPHN|nr:type II secretion system protein N [Sphingomonas donggukensis]URW74586.1 signaling protein [Sphingomonas donggukensis]
MILRRFEMTPYRIAQALDVLTALVIMSIAVALAHLTWRIGGHADTGAVTVPQVRRAAPVADVAPAIALAPFGRAGANGEGAPATGLPLVLKGIVFARPESLSIAYIANGSDVPKPYKVGEAVTGATIQAIQINRVLLLNGGRTEFLAFPDPFAKPVAPGTVVAAPAVTINAPPTLANPATSAVPDAAALINRLDAQPAAGGYRIGENAPPGLRPGDLVSQVNGQAVATPDAARDAFAKAQASGTAQITIQRDGKPVTLTIPVR